MSRVDGVNVCECMSVCMILGEFLRSWLIFDDSMGFYGILRESSPDRYESESFLRV
mgnify:CR=1 FL=1